MLLRSDNRRWIATLQASVEARDVADQDVRNPSRGGGATSSFGCATILRSVFTVSQIIATHHSGAHNYTSSRLEWTARRR
jgi:hypothetical protein